MTKIKIPAPLRKYTNEESVISTKAQNLFGIFEYLVFKYPQIKTHLFNEKAELHAFLRIFVGDKPNEVNGKEDVLLEKDHLIRIIPVIKGG